MSSIVKILRLVVMSALCCCSVIVLGTTGRQISLNPNYLYYPDIYGTIYPPYQGFAVAVAGLTLVIVPPLLVIGFVRKGAIFNYVAVELAVLGLLWILWLSSASYTAASLLFLYSNCDDYVDKPGDGAVDSCHEVKAMHGFLWLSWVILTGYWLFLLIMALIQRSRGNSVWTKTVNDMFAPRVVAVVKPGGGHLPQQQPVIDTPRRMEQLPQAASNPPSISGVPYPPVPTQSGNAPTQSPQIGYSTPSLPRYPQIMEDG